MSDLERKLDHFVRRYGAEQLAWLLDAFARGESGQVIADHLSVTRERVRQWKNTFGRSITVYQVYPEVSRRVAGREGDPSD
jgi:hypothetical protein